MDMRITKVGNKINTIYQGVCYKCDSEAEAVEDELTGLVNDQREGKFSWEICPVCKANTVINGKNYGGMLFMPKKER